MLQTQFYVLSHVKDKAIRANRSAHRNIRCTLATCTTIVFLIPGSILHLRVNPSRLSRRYNGVWITTFRSMKLRVCWQVFMCFLQAQELLLFVPHILCVRSSMTLINLKYILRFIARAAASGQNF